MTVFGSHVCIHATKLNILASTEGFINAFEPGKLYHCHGKERFKALKFIMTYYYSIFSLFLV